MVGAFGIWLAQRDAVRRSYEVCVGFADARRRIPGRRGRGRDERSTAAPVFADVVIIMGYLLQDRRAVLSPVELSSVTKLAPPRLTDR